MHENKNISAYRMTLKERILEKAMEAFSQKGIRAVKMDDVANMLSISKRTLYEIYDNKEDLLFEGVKKYKRLKEKEMRRIVNESQTVIDVILLFYRMKADEFRHTNAAFYSDIAKYPRILKYLDEDKKQNQKQFLDFMKRGVEEGYFRDDVNYELISYMFDALGNYLMVHTLYQKYSFEELFSNLVLTAVRGVCTLKGVEQLDKFIS